MIPNFPYIELLVLVAFIESSVGGDEGPLIEGLEDGTVVIGNDEREEKAEEYVDFRSGFAKRWYHSGRIPSEKVAEFSGRSGMICRVTDLRNRTKRNRFLWKSLSYHS